MEEVFKQDLHLYRHYYKSFAVSRHTGHPFVVIRNEDIEQLEPRLFPSEEFVIIDVDSYKKDLNATS
jgi:hypothetical protein